MPHRDDLHRTFDYPMSTKGVNLHKNIVELYPEECLMAQNLVWDNGMVKRGGQVLLNTSELVASNKILGIHRFYYGTSKKRIVSCETKISVDDEDNTWSNIHTWATGGLNTHFTTWGAVDKVYISNGTDRVFNYDGTSVNLSVASTLTVGSQPGAGQNSIVTITINGTANVGTEGSEWNVGADTTATAASIAAWLNGLTGISAANVATAVTVTPTSTSDLDTFTWTPVGTDTAAMVAIVHIALPAKTIQTLPYQDRLLTIDGNNPGELRWTASYSDASMELRANTGVRPDVYLYGMCNHSATNNDAGYKSMVLLAGANGMYVFFGTDLRPPYTTGDYTIYKLALDVGCNAPKTMVWTPRGTMWLGIDRQVYLLPFDSLIPIPVGTKIQSVLSAFEGIEKIPAAQITNACAVYHDGYYKLSYAGQNQTTNTLQYWLDLNRLSSDENGHFGPWYGPMTGQTISCYAVQNGPGDTGELIAGESSAKGYIYQLGERTDYGDIETSDKSTKAIQIYWQPPYNPLGNPEFKSTVDKMEAELLDVLGTVNINFHDITGSIKTGDSFGLSGSAVYWDDGYWDDEYWSSSAPTRQVIKVNPTINARRLSVIISHSSSTDTFELYSLKALGSERFLIFD